MKENHMNDLNSVLIEGTITAINDSSLDLPTMMEIKTYRTSQTAPKTVCTKLRVDVSCLLKERRSDLAAGRKIRVVGRLAKLGRTALLVVAEHIELKPLMV